jgi:hypothetical protein
MLELLYEPIYAKGTTPEGQNFFKKLLLRRPRDTLGSACLIAAYNQGAKFPDHASWEYRLDPHQLAALVADQTLVRDHLLHRR